jgi:uncharacterized membrane protein YoaK (UPF0700 family)
MRLLSAVTGIQFALAVFLALMSGYIDGYGLAVLGVYVSFMSGNTTSSGMQCGQSHFHAALPPTIAILFFVTGSFFGHLLTQSQLRHSHRIVFSMITTLLAMVAGLEQCGLVSAVLEIGSLSLAMGMMNPALSKIGTESVSLTFMTGTLNRVGGHLASAVGRRPLLGAECPTDSHLHRARIEASVWAGFLIGAALSGIAISHFRSWALLPPCLAMATLSLSRKIDHVAQPPDKPILGSVRG